MNTRMTKYLLAVGVAGTMAIGAANPSLAAPVMSSTAAVKSTAPTPIENVRFRHFGPGAFIGGLALGLAGAALASPYYYGPPAYAYDYGPTYYQYEYVTPGYAYAPAPYYWGGGPRWHYRHYRHW
jgi:hypothetical protein